MFNISHFLPTSERPKHIMQIARLTSDLARNTFKVTKRGLWRKKKSGGFVIDNSSVLVSILDRHLFCFLIALDNIFNNYLLLSHEVQKQTRNNDLHPFQPAFIFLYLITTRPHCCNKLHETAQNIYEYCSAQKYFHANCCSNSAPHCMQNSLSRGKKQIRNRYRYSCLPSSAILSS